ncbi:MAG: hypothetical protein ACTSPY_12775 [Candidatus Helarchaeota archaeon]
MGFNEIKMLFKDSIDTRKTFYYKKTLDALKTYKKLKLEELISILQLDRKEVLRILYKLFDLGFISYKRLEGEIIYWVLRNNSIRQIIKREKYRKINQLKKELEFEKNHTYFICEKCGQKISYFIAFDYRFKCPDCNNSLVVKENGKKIEVIEKQINRLLNI